MAFVTGAASSLDPGAELSTILVTTALMGLPGLYLLLRCPFVRVVVDHVGVHYYGYVSQRHRLWSQIEATRVVTAGGMIAESYVPSLVLTGRDDEEPLTALAGYTTDDRLEKSRMGRQERVIAKRLRLARSL
ncbi:hypothetical protein [Cellulomonas fimi]|uniref:hypothetical protein n=1 Tax=Cellulomonas fimi TaxID=1708 RepID=UPI000F82E602|nr:hypothetical protein [Cellulomonas fimi]NNH09176.1 hypothetical protein [Cellulomonas fimi]